MSGCDSCSGSSCSVDNKRMPPGIFQQYDLDQPVSEGNMVWIETVYKDGIPETTDNILEIVGKIRKEDDSRIFGVIFGHNEVKDLSKKMFSYGINTIYHIKDADLTEFDACQYSRCIMNVMSRVNPAALFLPSSEKGKELADLISSLSGVSVFKNCTDLSIKDRVITVTVVKDGDTMTEYGKSFPQIAIIENGSFPVPIPEYGTEGTIFYRENCCKCNR